MADPIPRSVDRLLMAGDPDVRVVGSVHPGSTRAPRPDLDGIEEWRVELELRALAEQGEVKYHYERMTHGTRLRWGHQQP